MTARNTAQQTAIGIQVTYSFYVLALLWLISCIIFCAAIKGPGTLIVWTIYGTLFFLAGWIVIGLPLIGLGDRIRRFPVLWLAVVAGLWGSFVMELPILIIYLVSLSARPERLVWEPHDLLLPGAAFLIAASGAVLYRIFLRKANPV